MPTFNADYIPPLRTAMEASDNARAAFQNEGEALFSGLGLGEGGFQAHAKRVCMLDDQGKLVSVPPYNAKDDNGMAAAARAGRLYIMDKNTRLRQVRLQGNENDGYAFMVTKTLKLRQLPRLTMNYFLKRFEVILDDFKKDMTKIYSDHRRSMAKYYDKLSDGLSRLFGRRKKTAPEEQMTEEAPLVSEETPSQKKEEELTQQTTQSELTAQALLAKSPLSQTTQEFDKYLDALDKRGNGKLVDAALNKENGAPKDYYEALAQELEGQVARHIRKAAPSEKEPEARNAFLEKRKPLMASISNDLRVFVKEQVDPQLVTDFYAKDLQARASMRTQLQQTASLVESTGVNAYTKDVLAQNEANRQTVQQNAPTVKQVQKDQPQPELHTPSIGGLSNRR